MQTPDGVLFVVQFVTEETLRQAWADLTAVVQFERAGLSEELVAVLLYL